MVVALGNLCSGVMWNDKPLADRVLGASETAGERMWPMPLIEEYKEGLKSDVADLNKVGPRSGGALTAGLFLRDFAGSTPWAHIDIAGTAFTEKDLPLGPKGGTGVGVRTLLTYLMAQAGRRSTRRGAPPPFRRFPPGVARAKPALEQGRGSSS
jgi:leucyl aminopeptidase